MSVVFDDDYIDEFDISSTLTSALEQLGQDLVMLSVSFLSSEEIKAVNGTERGVDSVTDVLSFPTLDGVRGRKILPKDFPFDVDAETGLVDIGCIAICTERAREQAAEYNHSLKREMNFLALHGLLHLLGYDHMTCEDESEMLALSHKILDSIGLDRSQDKEK